METFTEKMDWLNGLSTQAIADIPRYLPNLESENAGRCVMFYVMQPAADSTLVDIIFAASPGQFAVSVIGGANLTRVAGIFPINEPDEAVALAHYLLEERDGTDEEE